MREGLMVHVDWVSRWLEGRRFGLFASESLFFLFFFYLMILNSFGVERLILGFLI